MFRFQVQTSNPGFVVLDRTAMRRVFRAAGNEIAAVARKKIRQAQAGGRTYYVVHTQYSRYRGMHTSSAPGEAPARMSGELQKSLKVYPFKSGEGVAVRARAFYSKFLEVGAVGGGGKKGTKNKVRRGPPRVVLRASTPRVLAPRDFLGGALDSRAASIEQRVKDAVIRGTRFVRMRP